ncbi:protein SIEVE ELEMENT OCCLUSION B-like [Diospyros lotus]|uniref:protein SIEVE ELEMENT OCCLUSION B-like n=1 Tax=Diospyros lotus TaxID=55363 RepID=UPI00225801F7|nr:protein SIEVE ELEMENT OCCLUSION B-like [Diospyros lotus]
MATPSAADEKTNLNVEESLLKQILGTHKPLDAKKFDAIPLLDAVQDVIQRASGTPVGGSDGKASKSHLRYKLENSPYEAIKKVSCEFSCNCSRASSTSEVAIELLQSLGSYSWEAKAVITLAAFAANYGSYFQVSQLYGSNDQFDKSLAFLQLSPNLLKHTPLKLKSEAVDVVKAIFDLTQYIVEVKTFQSQYVGRKLLSSIFTAHEDDLAKAVYLSIQSTVACAWLLMNTVTFGNVYKPTAKEAQELSDLVIEIHNIREELESHMESWKKHIEGIILREDYDRLVRILKGTYTDNMEILKALLCSKESREALIYNCSSKTEVELDQLSGKHVLLYITSLEHLSEDEISILSEKYASKSTTYEIVWVPIVEESTSWNEEVEKHFKKARDSMLWFSISNPWKLGKAVITYIKEVWKFEDKSQLVALNPQGKFVKSGAVDLFWIWGKTVFQSRSPDGKEEDEQLWKGTTIQLLVDTLGTTINEWIAAQKYIFLFGGEDIKWIQKFTDSVCEVAKAAKIDIVMIYVGKSNMKWAAHQKIWEQKYSSFDTVFRFTQQKYLSSFWATLQSIWQTKMDNGKSIVDSTTMEDIVTLLSFDASGEGWTAICHGSRPKMAKARDETILDILSNYAKWAALTKQLSFVDALVEKIKEGKTHETHHECYSLAVAATTGSTPKKVKCLLCDHTMRTFITYRCCSDH